jgi:hypothetical protein
LACGAPAVEFTVGPYQELSNGPTPWNSRDSAEQWYRSYGNENRKFHLT